VTPSNLGSLVASRNGGIRDRPGQLLKRLRLDF
jgi:hypothetical protein